MWEAYYAALVHKSTGLDEEAIRWDLPLNRGLAYMHVALILQGNETVWPNYGESSAEIQNVRDMLKNKPWRKA